MAGIFKAKMASKDYPSEVSELTFIVANYHWMQAVHRKEV